MPTDNEPRSAAAIAQDVLRGVLENLIKFVPAPKVLALLPAEDRNNIFSVRNLHSFISNKSHVIGQEYYDMLARAWLYTPLGRALRAWDSKENTSEFDKLMTILASGNAPRRDMVAAEGVYFMYHRSYLERQLHVVRVIQVSAKDDYTLSVIDTLYDNRSGANKNMVANGVMIFEDEHPQMLLHGTENKRGLSLIIGSVPSVTDGVLTGITGGLMVMRKGGAVAYRRCRLAREPQGDPTKMIEESGIFTKAEMAVPERRKHQTAFAQLSKNSTHEV